MNEVTQQEITIVEKYAWLPTPKPLNDPTILALNDCINFKYPDTKKVRG